MQGIPQGAATSSLLCALHLRTLADTVFLPLIQGTEANALPAERCAAAQSTNLPRAPAGLQHSPPPLLLNMTDDFLLLACDDAGAHTSGAAALVASAAAEQLLSKGATQSLQTVH